MNPVTKLPPDWRLYPFPRELTLVPDQISPEIRQVIQESCNRYVVIQQQAIDDLPSRISSLGNETETAVRVPFTNTRFGKLDSNAVDLAVKVDPPLNQTEGVSSNYQVLPANGPDINKVRFPCTSDSVEKVGKVLCNEQAAQKFMTMLNNKTQKIYEFLWRGGGSSQHRTEQDTYECLACVTEYNTQQMVSLSCQHRYCLECFNMLVHTGCENDRAFPPKCCGKTVSAKLIMEKASQRAQRKYALLAAKIAIPLDSRWYCPRSSCGQAIDMRKAKVSQYSGLQCSHCLGYICVLCREPAHHSGSRCNSASLKATLEEAARMGWRRCYDCRTMIELGSGCSHITCWCGAEFCYVCERKWRTCKDPLACVMALDRVRSVVAMREAEMQRQAFLRMEDARQRTAAALAAQVEEEIEINWAIQQVSRLIEQESQESLSRYRSRSSQITERFGTYRYELQRIREHQETLLANRHKKEVMFVSQYSTPESQSADRMWFEHMVAMRADILAQDEALIREDGIDFKLEDYRSIARLEVDSLVEDL